MRILGLVVDDEPLNVSEITRRIRTRFDQIGWRIEWTEAGKPVEIEELSRSGHERFHLAVVDLLYQRPDVPNQLEPDGLDAIRTLRQWSEDTYILAITNGDPRYRDLLEQARAAGANRAISREQMSTGSDFHSPEKIVAEVAAWLGERGAADVVRVEFIESDAGVASVVEKVGQSALGHLGARCLGHHPGSELTLELTFLSSGHSGALVIAVRPADGPTAQHVIKISSSSEQLVEELRRSRQAEEVLPSTLLVSPVSDHVHGPVGPWYAIGSRMAAPALTLRRWLREEPGDEAIGDLVRELMVEGLATAYAPASGGEKATKSWLSWSLSGRLRLRESTAVLAPALAQPRGAALPDSSTLLDDLERLVVSNTLLDAPVELLPAVVPTRLGFGDLHAANVLVLTRKRPRPVLVDAAMFGSRHWAADPARLSVDLLLRDHDGGVDSLFWDRFESWRSTAAMLCPVRDCVALDDAPGQQTPAVAVITSLMDNMPEYLPGVTPAELVDAHHWEWHVAVLQEFLRSASHSDLSPSKRALALVSAHSHLLAARRWVPLRRGDF